MNGCVSNLVYEPRCASEYHNTGIHAFEFEAECVCGAAGGYTLRNVARCWCFETSRCLGLDLPDQLPDSVSQLLEQLPESAS